MTFTSTPLKDTAGPLPTAERIMKSDIYEHLSDEDLKELYAEQARIEKLIQETEQLKAEEYGVPVGTARSGKYIPKSMKDIFGDGEKVDEALIDQITDYDYCQNEALLPVGIWWVTSNTCY